MMAGCLTCRYSQVDHAPDEGYDDGPLMRCHRYPPQVFALGDEAAQTWPNVGPDDWCGEHRPERRPGTVEVQIHHGPFPPSPHSRLGPHPGDGPLAY
jgi:hypothetical protein